MASSHSFSAQTRIKCCGKKLNSFHWLYNVNVSYRLVPHPQFSNTSTNIFCYLCEWEGAVGFTWSCWGVGWGPGPGCPERDGGVSGRSAAGSAGGGSASRPHGEIKLPAGAPWLLRPGRHTPVLRYNLQFGMFSVSPVDINKAFNIFPICLPIPGVQVPAAEPDT